MEIGDAFHQAARAQMTQVDFLQHAAVEEVHAPSLVVEGDRPDSPAPLSPQAVSELRSANSPKGRAFPAAIATKDKKCLP